MSTMSAQDLLHISVPVSNTPTPYIYNVPFHRGLSLTAAKSSSQVPPTSTFINNPSHWRKYMFQSCCSSSFISSNYRATEQISRTCDISSLVNTGKVKAIDLISIIEPLLIQKGCGITTGQSHFFCEGSACNLKASFALQQATVWKEPQRRCGV